MPKERVAIGMVADAVTWWHAATLVQQLKNLKTKLQIVVFYLGTIDGPVATTFNALGARVKPITMPVPFPETSKFWNNKRDNLLRIAEGDVVARWYAPYAKLAAWNQTEWHKVVLLDTDVVIAKNIDEMAQFPKDTFSPEACAGGPARKHCQDAEIGASINRGFNAGVMVVGPNAERFSAMLRYADGIAAKMRAAPDAKAHHEIENLHLAYPEQSFLKRFWFEVEGVSPESGHMARRGWNWETVELHGYNGKAVNVMSRLYNARPYDCEFCDAAYLERVKIVHFTCGYKPWMKKNDQFPCSANWTVLWHNSYYAACEVARQHGAECGETKEHRREWRGR